MANYKTLSDLDLSTLVREGNRLAYTEIFNRYNSLLCIHAFKKFGNREQAKDMVQEVFAMLWNDRESLEPKSNLAGYLYTCVHRRLLNWINHKKIESKYIQSLQGLLDSDMGTTDNLVREKQLSEIIKREIDSLPERMRQVFMMSRYQQLSHKEIAEELGISEESVRSHVKGALKTLRVRLGLFSYLIFILWY